MINWKKAARSYRAKAKSTRRVYGGRVRHYRQQWETEKARARQFREALMWSYARGRGADSIVGLHVCDDYLDWEAAMLDGGVRRSGPQDGAETDSETGE